MPTYISNPLMGKEFTQIALTTLIEKISVPYNFITQMNLFKPEIVSTTVVGIEERDTQTQLVLARPRGMKDNFLNDGKNTTRKRVWFEVPHLPIDDPISVADIQNVVMAGSNKLESLRSLVQRRLENAKVNLQATIEYLQFGALQGRVMNTDGTLLFDLFDEFNITQTVVDFALGNTNTEPQAKCNEVTRAIDLALGGDLVGGYMCLASDTFFDAFITHDNVKNAYAATTMSPERLGGDVRRGFYFGGVNFVNYNPIVKGPTGTNVTFLAEGDAIFFPKGTRKAFQKIIAPAYTFEAINKAGTEFYARRWEDPDGQSVHLHSESNVLPICANPGVLVKATL